MLFAPVCFTGTAYLSPGFVYRPTYLALSDYYSCLRFTRVSWLALTSPAPCVGSPGVPTP